MHFLVTNVNIPAYWVIMTRRSKSA